MRFVFVLLLYVIFFNSSLVFGQCPTTPSAFITGDTCLGSTLTVSSPLPPSSIVWTLNGTTTVSVQTATLQINGTVIAGNNSGIGGSAANELQNPDRMFVAADGTVYIPDLGNSRVQKWPPGATAGITVAGGNGAGSAANQFSRPTSLFVDNQGYIYVADQSNGRIQKWAPGATSGVTVAGGSAGVLNLPTDVFVDAQGTIYVSEQGNAVVKKWVAGSQLSIVIAGGNGYGSAANQLSTPTGIYVDAQGNVYICDTDNNRVQKWSPGASSGITVAGGNGYGPAANQLANPLEIYVDCAGTMYIADYNNNRIQKWLTGALSGVSIAGGTNQLNGPIGVFMDAALTLYIAEFNNNRVQKFISPISSSFTPTAAGTYTATVYYNGGSIISNAITIVAPETISVSIAASATNICTGDTVRFSATPVNADAVVTYQWKKNGVNAGNNSGAYTGNNFANGDKIACEISVSGGCFTATTAKSNTIALQVNALPVVSLNHTATLCEGDSRQLAAGNFAAYLWNDGSTASAIIVNTPGTYYVTVTNSNGCKASDTTRITTLFPVPSDFLPADTVICSKTTLVLKPTSMFTSYLWSTGTTDTVLPVTLAGVYWLQVTDSHNCKGKATITIGSKQCLSGFYMPTGFTPNNDGRNDFLRPIISGELVKYEFRVYNRWGQPIFYSTNPQQGWDGKLSGQSSLGNVYVWMCNYQLKDQPAETKKGTVVLIK